MKLTCIVLASLCAGNIMAASLTDFEAISLAGDRTQIVLTFDEPVVDEPVSYAIEDPARISLDFDNMSSSLEEKYIQIGNGNTRGATVLDANNKTRIVLNLTQLLPYATEIEGNKVSVYIGEGVDGLVKTISPSNEPEALVEGEIVREESVTAAPLTQPVVTPMSPPVKSIKNEIVDIDFRRSANDAGQVIVELSDKNANASVFEKGGSIYIKVDDYKVPQDLRRRLDVIDFATAVHFINIYNEDGNALIRLEVEGDYEYLAYQTDDTMTVEVNQLTEDEALAKLKNKFPYTGEKLSLNFQDIEVRDVLQIIANYVGFNLVAADSVNGTITLRLNNVPWDQALDLVLKTNGLDKRQNGNVWLVAPAAELAEQEKLELSTREQTERLAPLRTEYVQVNYAKATDIAEIIRTNVNSTSITEEVEGEKAKTTTMSDNGFLSSRGSVTVDDRTNTLIITDTAANLEGIRRAITVFDVPVRQVLIEARVVTTSTRNNEGLGVRWGNTFINRDGNKPNAFYGSGSIDQNVNSTNALIDNSDLEITYPDAFAVDLPLNQNSGSFAIGVLNGFFNLDLELQALESLGQAEVISQPKVITSDGQRASIFSGQSVAILGELVEAGLKLDVTPQITPDDRVFLSLTVNQDSIAPPESSSGLVAIDTNTVSTQVLVDNGSTLVLGGVYRTEKASTVTKTPVLGDLPVIGNLFKRTVSADTTSELLIFITPKLVKEGLVSY